MIETFETLDDAMCTGISRILSEGKLVKPREQLTKEILGFNFTLSNPLARLIFNPARRWSLPLAIGEFCWHSSGSNRVDEIAHYASAWRQSSDDGKSIPESCYGLQIFSSLDGVSQWQNLKELLKYDPDSRRASISFSRRAINENINASDVSCTTSCQFLVRDGAVHLFVTMRSNDAIWGLPYDVFFFTLLQERLAIELNYNLGSYHHHVASFHIYERHFALAERVVECRDYSVFSMIEMEEIEKLPFFLQNEETIRQNGKLPNARKLSGYWGELESVLLMAEQSRLQQKEHGRSNFLNLVSNELKKAG